MQLPIVLVGPMGAGKTTLGKKLAKSLSVEFLDTDKLISKDHGPITSLFENLGEQAFREIETNVLRHALSKDAVIATGGGIVLRDANRELLKNHRVIFLDSSAKHVLPKINVEKRPLLKSNPDAWGEIYNQRLPLYKEVAKETLFTGGKPVSVALKELIELAGKDSNE